MSLLAWGSISPVSPVSPWLTSTAMSSRRARDTRVTSTQTGRDLVVFQLVGKMDLEEKEGVQQWHQPEGGHCSVTAEGQKRNRVNRHAEIKDTLWFTPNSVDELHQFGLDYTWWDKSDLVKQSCSTNATINITSNQTT